MYFQLTNALKRRFIKELRTFWQHHPRYRDIVDHIQGKYSFKERPSYGIIVKTGSGSRVDLSADNYMGVVVSYVYLTRVQNYPGIAVEWVREDQRAIRQNDNRFPSAPGVYFMELTADDEFYVDPLLDIYHEPVLQVDPSTAQLQRAPLAGTTRIYEMPAGYMLQEGINYTLTLDGAGKPTGEIRLTKPLTGGRTLSGDYRYPGESTGPHKFVPGRSNNSAIPGCVMAFGRRNEKGDRFAIVVQDIRRPAALEYGGKWELTLDFDVTARDVYAQQEIADQTVIYLWGMLAASLSSEGIEMTDLSLGGESEEIFDENGDDYFYNSSFTVTVQTDWSIHVPINMFLRQVAPLTSEQVKVIAGLDDAEVAGFQSNIKMLDGLGLEHIVDPFFAGRNSTYEVIR